MLAVRRKRRRRKPEEPMVMPNRGFISWHHNDPDGIKWYGKLSGVRKGDVRVVLKKKRLTLVIMPTNIGITAKGHIVMSDTEWRDLVDGAIREASALLHAYARGSEERRLELRSYCLNKTEKPKWL
jgi:hypothetical protein